MPCIDMEIPNKLLLLLLTSSYEGSNSSYAIKPKKPVKRQADTETQWNTSQVSLFYLFH